MTRHAPASANAMPPLLWRKALTVLSLATAFFIAAPPIFSQREYTDIPVVAEGKTLKISPNVYVIPDENRRGVPNVGIVVGTRATLIIDPGMGRKSGEVIAREAAKVSKGTEIYVVNTHFHPEHTTGEAGLPAAARVIRAVAQQQDIESEGMKFVQMFASRSAALSELLEDIKGFRAPAEVFERERTLDLGGVRVRLLWLGPGHTRGDTAILVEGDRVLFSGDLAMKEVFPAFTSAHSNIATWLAALEQMAGLRPAQVVGAHYGMGDASIIAAYRSYFTELRARIGALKAQGLSPDDAARTLQADFQKKYPSWDQPVRVQGAVTAAYSQVP
jgi:glyoxylase-like metal-dependent hydrolase (beta-lactamase superfamily II)